MKKKEIAKKMSFHESMERGMKSAKGWKEHLKWEASGDRVNKSDKHYVGGKLVSPAAFRKSIDKKK